MANQRLNSKVTIGAALDRSVSGSLGTLQAGLSNIGDEIKNIERQQRDLGRQRRILERQGESVAALDREYEQLERTLGDLRRQQERWNRAAAASRRFGAAGREAIGSIGRTARNAAIGVGVAGAAVFGLANNVATLGDDAAKLADSVGIGIEELQELRYAAERAGVATETFDTALQRMTRNIGMALEGTGAAADAMDALGLSAERVAAMSPEDALAAIADRLQDVETQSERAAIAADIFGRSGVDMLNMLRDGSEGLEEMARQARRTGYVLSEEAARDAETFKDRMLDAELVLKGVRNTIGTELIPVVSDAMREFSDWAISNREGIAAFAGEIGALARDALPVLVDLGKGIGRIAGQVGRATAGVADFVGGWENLGVIVGGALLARTVVKVGQFAGAAWSLGRALWALGPALPLVSTGIRAIGVALMANPIGLAVAAIAGGAALIIKNWDSVGPWFSDLWTDVRGYFGGAYDFIAGAFSLDMGRVVDGFTGMWNSAKGVIGTVMRGIGGVFRATWSNVIKPVTDALGVTEPIVAAWEAVRSGVGAVLTWLADKFTTVMAKLQPLLDGLGWILDKAGAIGGKLEEIGSSIGIRSSVSNIPPNSPLGRLQGNARGGPFGPGWHLTGEHGPEMKFESRSGYVATAAAVRSMSLDARRAGRGGSAQAAPALAPVSIVVNAQGVSAEEVVAEIERRARRATGSSLFDRPMAYGR